MFEGMTLDQKKNLFVRASATYHSANADQTPITDEQYDRLKRDIREDDPGWAPLRQAGWKVNDMSPLDKCNHRGFMGSIYNAYDYAPKSLPEEQKWESGFKLWFDNAGKQPVWGCHKVDGLSVAIEYKDFRMQTALLRGDCIEGESVHHHMLLIRDVPAFIPTKRHIVVRGEVVMTTSDWERYKKLHPEAKNARNMTAGIMGRKEVGDSSFLRFFAHGMDILLNDSEVPPSTFEEKMDALKYAGFVTPQGVMCHTVEEAKAWHEQVGRDRAAGKIPYEIDGVVYIINDSGSYAAAGVDSGRCPRGAVAWKFPSFKASTTFNDVEVSTGHSGKLTPTALVDPVGIGGITVSRASLSNWELIGRMKLCHGDTIEIERCGDVIPGVVGVVKHNKGKPVSEPTECPVCKGAVGRRALNGKKGGVSADTFCMNPDCEAKSTGKINKWISETGIMDVGKSTVEAMVEAELISDPADLYLLMSTELAEMPFGKTTFGMNRAAKTIGAISHRKVLPLNTFIAALGIQGLGEGIVKQVREKKPGQFDTIDDWLVPAKLVMFKDEISLPNVAVSIANGLGARAALIGKLLAAGVTIQSPKPAKTEAGGPLAGKVFCLTGDFPEKKAVIGERIIAAGGQIEDDVRSNVNVVMVNELPEPGKETGKLAKAKKKGITVMTLNDLNQLVKFADYLGTPDAEKVKRHGAYMGVAQGDVADEEEGYGQ